MFGLSPYTIINEDVMKPYALMCVVLAGVLSFSSVHAAESHELNKASPTSNAMPAGVASADGGMHLFRYDKTKNGDGRLAIDSPQEGIWITSDTDEASTAYWVASTTSSSLTTLTATTPSPKAASSVKVPVLCDHAEPGSGNGEGCIGCHPNLRMDCGKTDKVFNLILESAKYILMDPESPTEDNRHYFSLNAAEGDEGPTNMLFTATTNIETKHDYDSIQEYTADPAVTGCPGQKSTAKTGFVDRYVVWTLKQGTKIVATVKQTFYGTDTTKPTFSFPPKKLKVTPGGYTLTCDITAKRRKADTTPESPVYICDNERHIMTQEIYAIRMEFVVPGEGYNNGENPAAEPVPTEFIGVSDPRPTITLEPAPTVSVKNSIVSVVIQGYVRDPIADNVPRGAGADIATVSITVNGDTKATPALTQTEVDAEKAMWKQHPYKGIIPKQTITFKAEAGSQTVRVETSENAAGNTGFAEFVVNLNSHQVPGN